MSDDNKENAECDHNTIDKCSLNRLSENVGILKSTAAHRIIDGSKNHNYVK